MADKDVSGARSWRYWRDKYGEIEALREYYPATLANNLVLQAAVAQVELGLRAINSVMNELSDKDEDENG